MGIDVRPDWWQSLFDEIYLILHRVLGEASRLL